MSPNLPLLTTLESYQALGRQILDLVEQEASLLAQGEPGLPKHTTEAKQRLLPQLATALQSLRQHRMAWQQRGPHDRTNHPEVTVALRSTQDLLMRVILRDRENEQRLLRAGSIPSRHLAKVQSPAQPNYVADLYRRHQQNPPQV
ncbi:MAG: hypothetical protein JNN07_22120 [Verrucomicrobiales bacterium]|nr:hypothetical protein [Verrucomicrobiales bacterium]